MPKTLLILSTHFVNEGIVAEYKKMRDTPNIDVILAIDNNAYKCNFKNRIENKIFYDISVRCFFFDSILHDELELPYFTGNDNTEFAEVMWHNSDYRFYYVRKYFPDYDYYWQIEYDVFCNAPTYEGFLKKFNNDRSDLIVQNLHFGKKIENIKGSEKEWIYKTEGYYKCIYPVVRLSARAIDFLYKRRLEHKKIFNPEGGKNSWLHSEPFTATELMNNGFHCSNLNEEHVTLDADIYLNDDRFFLTPNDKLYHPVKYGGKELSDMKKYLRKYFCERLISLSFGINIDDLQKFQVYFNEDFTLSIIPITNGGEQESEIYYTVSFTTHIIMTLYCQGKFKNIDFEQFSPYKNLLKDCGIMHTEQATVIYTVAYLKFNNINATVSIFKKLIDGTFPVINKYLRGC